LVAGGPTLLATLQPPHWASANQEHSSQRACPLIFSPAGCPWLPQPASPPTGEKRGRQGL